MPRSFAASLFLSKTGAKFFLRGCENCHIQCAPICHLNRIRFNPTDKCLRRWDSGLVSCYENDLYDNSLTFYGRFSCLRRLW